MKRILIISSVFKPEPVVSARISEDIAIAASKNYQVDVFTPYPSRPKGFDFKQHNFLSSHYNQIIANSYVYPDSKFWGRMKESISFGLATYRLIKNNREHYSMIYANTKPLFALYFTLLACKIYRLPLIFHIQDVYPESMFGRLKSFKLISYFFILIDRLLYNYASGIIVISEKMKEYISASRHIMENRILVVRNWQKIENRDIVNQKKNKFTFMFAGSISPAAGVELLINAFIEASIPDAQLIIAGDGTSKGLCEKLVREQQATNIYFEALSPDNVLEVQSSADVLLLPLKKGIGLTASPSKLSAYMLSGKPIIASVDKGSDTEYIINKSKCGLVTDAESVKDVSLAMKKIRRLNKDELDKMGNNGKKFAQEEMSKEINLSKIIGLINSVVK